MATTEERLAELEAKMAALTTPPDDYYTSRYSGEEIDNGIDRAKSGGAIDKAIQAKANPNLLDNWYFGNPVNQRGQTEYADAGYTIDRWKSPSTGSVQPALKMVDGGIQIAYDLYQYLDEHVTKGILGKNATVSILFASGTLFCNSFDISESERLLYPVDVNSNGVSRCLLVVDPSNFQGCFLRIEPSTNGSLSDTILSIKFELGSQQTLAHQDENGNWQLNELPNYADTLARCQRYAVKLNGKYWMALNADGTLRLNIPFPVTMRAKPSVTFSQESQNTGTVVFDDNLSDENQIQFYMTNNGGWVNVNNIFATADL